VLLLFHQLTLLGGCDANGSTFCDPYMLLFNSYFPFHHHRRCTPQYVTFVCAHLSSSSSYPSHVLLLFQRFTSSTITGDAPLHRTSHPGGDCQCSSSEQVSASTTLSLTLLTASPLLCNSPAHLQPPVMPPGASTLGLKPPTCVRWFALYPCVPCFALHVHSA
jgi:hypothetical protein